MAKLKEIIAAGSPPVMNIHAVAERLFAAAWRPRANIDAWMIAVEAYRGAAELVKVAEQISAGYSPDDVIAEKMLQEESAVIGETKSVS